MIYSVILQDYINKKIPKAFQRYNVSDIKIDDLQDSKLLQLPKLHLLKLKKEQISKDELEEQYFRGLDSRGQHLISTDYNNCILVCNCENYRHKKSCPIPYLKKYMLMKNCKIEKFF